MRRSIVLAIALAISLAGCLRNQFDLCAGAEPHPECDAGRAIGGSDAGLDAGPKDAETAMDSGLDGGSEAPADSGAEDADASRPPDGAD